MRMLARIAALVLLGALAGTLSAFAGEAWMTVQGANAAAVIDPAGGGLAERVDVAAGPVGVAAG